MAISFWIRLAMLSLHTYCLHLNVKGSTTKFYPFRSYCAFTGVTVCILARYPLDTFVNGLQCLDFSPHCHSCYKALTFTLTGLSPVGYVQLRWTYNVLGVYDVHFDPQSFTLKKVNVRSERKHSVRRSNSTEDADKLPL